MYNKNITYNVTLFDIICFCKNVLVIYLFIFFLTNHTYLTAINFSTITYLRSWENARHDPSLAIIYNIDDFVIKTDGLSPKPHDDGPFLGVRLKNKNQNTYRSCTT